MAGRGDEVHGEKVYYDDQSLTSISCPILRDGLEEKTGTSYFSELSNPTWFID